MTLFRLKNMFWNIFLEVKCTYPVHVHGLPSIYLSYNWKFVLSVHLHPVLSPLTPPLLATINLTSFSEFLFICFCFHIPVISYSIWLCLLFLSRVPSRFIHVVTNDTIFVYRWIVLNTPHSLHAFIFWWLSAFHGWTVVNNAAGSLGV